MELRHSSSVDTWRYHNLDLSLCLNNQNLLGLEPFIFRCEEPGFPENRGDTPIHFTLEENSGSSYSAAPNHPISVTPQPAQWFSLKRRGYTFLATGGKQQVSYAERSMLAYITDVGEAFDTTKVSVPHELFILFEDKKKFSRNLLSSALADW